MRRIQEIPFGYGKNKEQKNYLLFMHSIFYKIDVNLK